MQTNRKFLDSDTLRDRMKSSRSRPVPAVRPRAKVTYKRVIPITDIVAPKKPASQPTPASPSFRSAQSRKVDRVKVMRAKEIAARSKVSPSTSANLDSKQQLAMAAAVWREDHQEEPVKSPAKPFVQFALIGMAFLVFAVGILAAVNSFRVDKQIVEAQQSQQTGNAEESDVDESKPTEQDMTSYSVAPDMPRYLKIPKLDVFSRVQHLGLDEDGNIAAPHNIYDVAWYKDSVVPGSPGGASIIDGHVSGPSQHGVLFGLDKLAVGDELSVERGDGKEINYRVVKTEILDLEKVDMLKMLLPATVGKHGLNLISCTGEFDSQINNYTQRVIVYTEVI